MRDTRDVSGAGLQPLVCEMLRSDRSVGSFGRAIVRLDRSAGRSFARIIRPGDRSVGSFDQAIVRSDRSAGRPAGGPKERSVGSFGKW